MLPGPVVLERVELVAGRVAQVVEDLRPVEHPELGERAGLDVGGHMLAAQAVPDAFRLSVGVGEGADHFSKSKRYQSKSVGRLACQNRNPLTLVLVISLAAADGLV